MNPAESDTRYRNFYEDSWAAHDTGKVRRSYGRREDRYALESHPEWKEIRQFVRDFDLRDRRVLEVGGGSAVFQDLVTDYTAIDIAWTAGRFFHKPFVCASATSLSFADNTFDAIWTSAVLEHVPNPEEALREMARVLKNGGLLYLSPAWQCRPWAAEGYQKRPYSDFGLKGKLIKASIPLRDSVPFRASYVFPRRALSLLRSRLSRKPRSLRFGRLTPNYEYRWQSDGDAVNSMDPFEVILWFEKRGHQCLNYKSVTRQFLVRTGPLILRIAKPD